MRQLEVCRSLLLGAAIVWPHPATAAGPEQFANQAIASPYHFPNSLRRAVIRYRLERADSAPFALPETGEQRVLRRGTAVVIEVCARCGRERIWTPEELAPYLQPNGLVDSDSPQVRARARGIRARRPAHAMRELTTLVRTLMGDDVNFDAQLSASEALRQRRGDCGEYAVLLAALGRARGIPTRVVNGIAYNTRFGGKANVFGPHVWVQAHIGGRWQAFDAALGEPGSMHIALSYGSGDLAAFAADGELRRQLRITAAGVVPPRR